MDPISQGIVGSTASLSGARSADPSKIVALTVLGFLAGMAPDLDVFIRSTTDPLLYLEYHRGFTHSLLFIPVGGLICALALFYLFRKRLRFFEAYLACTLGYATHGLLDGCTTYGTMLLWPFSDERISWNVISIIDPLFTVPLIAFVVVCCRQKTIRPARYAALYGLTYLLIGQVQHQRAVAFGESLAFSRGHEVQHVEAKPSFANVGLWKLIYEHDGVFHVDAVNLYGSPKLYEGQSIAKLDLLRDLPNVPNGSTTANDIARFTWFSRGYVALHPERADYVIDVRYSLVPNTVQPLWGIQIPADTTLHTPFHMLRKVSEERKKKFYAMLFRGEVTTTP